MRNRALRRPAKQRVWALYLVLLGKVIFFTLPMAIFLLALHVLPVMVENVLTSKGIWLRVPSSLVIALKLWGFLVGVMGLTASLTFWWGFKAKASHGVFYGVDSQKSDS